MIMRFILSLFVCIVISGVLLNLATGKAHAQAAVDPDPDRCRGVACLLRGGGISIAIKPAVRKRVVKPRQKVKVKPRRVQKAKSKKRQVRKRRAPQPVRKKTVRRKSKPVVPRVQKGPSWEGLPNRAAIVLTDAEMLPLTGTFLMRFNLGTFEAQSIDVGTLTEIELAGILDIEPFQVRSIQRRFLPGAVLNLSSADAARLADSPFVERLSTDTVIKPASTQRPRLSWGLDRLDQPNLPLDGQFERRQRTGNLRVYLLDSGVDRRHPEFGDRVVFGASFVPVVPSGADTFCRLHGTEMASLIMGKSMGVAADIRLVDVTVLPCLPQEVGAASSLIEGLYWVAEREDALRPRKLSVVNLSLTGPQSPDVNDWVNQLVGMGISVVVAAGNQGKDACAYSPASASKAITVAAVDYKDKIAPFSNTGTCVKLHAPGVKVTAASAANYKQGVASNGTSAASAYVSGILASNLTQVVEGRGKALLTANGVNIDRAESAVLLAQASSQIIPHCRVSNSVRSLNLRKSPTVQAPSIAKLSANAAVEVLAIKDSWAQVKTQNALSGWVAMQVNEKILLRKNEEQSRCR